MNGTIAVTSQQVQAAAAALVALLTVGLLIVGGLYVRWTKRMVNEIARGNELQADANRITASGLALAEGQAEPKLAAKQHGRRADADSVVAPLVVSNLGGGAAERVVVRTDWGNAQLPEPIPAGGVGRTQVTMARADWDRLPRDKRDPEILGFETSGS